MVQEEIRPMPGEKPKSRACLYGCLGMVVVFCVLAIVGVFGAFYAVSTVSKVLVEEMTDSEPVPLPEMDYTEEEVAKVRLRVDDFVGALDGAVDMDVLVLSGEDINALLRSEPAFAAFADSMYVRIEDGEVRGELSLPLDLVAKELHLPDWMGVQGRYLNGAASFTVSLDEGRLLVYIESMTLKGGELPAEALAPLRNQNLAQDFTRNPETREVIEKLSKITIENDKLYVHLAEQN